MSTAAASNRLDGPEMTRRTIEMAQQTAARVAWFTYRFTLATVVFANHGISAHLIVASTAAEASVVARATSAAPSCSTTLRLVHGIHL